MDFGTALTNQFRDPRWLQKTLTAALLSLFPIFGQIFVTGWALGITRRMIEGGETLLPEIDLAADFIRGLKVWGLNLVYALPGIFMALPLAVGIGFMAAVDQGQTAIVWALTSLCLMVLLIGYTLVLSYYLPAAYANFIASGERFSAGLNLAASYRLIRRSPVAYFMVFIGGMMCTFITLIGLAGCVIGVVLTGVYSQTIMAQLYGQAYREAKSM
jgi:hypothetical protein